MKLKSRHSIFRKGNTVLKLLGCVLTSDAFRRRYHDITDIMESYSGESWKRFMWLCLGCEKVPDLSNSYGLILLYEMTRDIEIFYVHNCVHSQWGSMTWQIYAFKSMHESS